MKNSDFLNIQSLNDITILKVDLRKKIEAKEVSLQHEVTQIKSSWNVFHSIASTFGGIFSFTNSTLVFFRLGFRIAKKLFAKKRQKTQCL